MPRAVVVVVVDDVARLADRARTPRELRDAEGEVLAQGDRVDGVVLGVLGRGGEPARDELLGEHRGRVRELLLVEEHGEDVEDVLRGVSREQQPRLRERGRHPRAAPRRKPEAWGPTRRRARAGNAAGGPRGPLSRDSRARISLVNDRLRGSRADGAPRARRAPSSSSISTGCCWRKSCRARARALAQNTPRGTARDSASGRESSRTRAASLARAASSIRARARVGARPRAAEGAAGRRAPSARPARDPLLAARS